MSDTIAPVIPTLLEEITEKMNSIIEGYKECAMDMLLVAQNNSISLFGEYKKLGDAEARAQAAWHVLNILEGRANTWGVQEAVTRQLVGSAGNPDYKLAYFEALQGVLSTLDREKFRTHPRV